jgi:hypothetical protein
MRDTRKKYVVNEDGTINPGYGRQTKVKKSTMKAIQDYKVEYIRDNYRQFMVKINKNRYPDIIEYLENMDAVAPYIIELVRQDMNRKLAEERKTKAAGEEN